MTPNTDDGTSRGRTIDRRTFLQAGAGVGMVSLAGCLDGLTGGGDDTIKVGHLAPAEMDMGKGSIRSARMAIEEINDEGGILGTDVELIEKDTAGDPSRANTLVQELLGADVRMISGTFLSETMLAIADRVGESDVVFLDTGSASPKITANYPGKNYDRFKNIFRNNPTNSVFQAELLGDYAKFLADTHGWKQFAVVVEDAEWTKEITQHTKKRIEEHGLTVTLNKRIAPDTNDFTPILDEVESSGARAMIKGFAHLSGASMLSTWATNEYPFAQEGINVASMSPSFWNDTNGGCLYETVAVSAAGGFAEITEKTVPFRKAYQKRHDSRPVTPMYMGFGTYDAQFIYKEAVEAAGTTDYKNDLDAIVAELEATDYTGTCGRINFFPKKHEYTHDVKPGIDLAPFPVVQWQQADGDGLAGSSGTKACVWPEKHATGDHQKPAWM